MKLGRAVSATILLAVLMSCGSAVSAKKKPWDLDRFSKCLQTTGRDELAPNLIVTSQPCNSSRNPIVSTENMPGDLRALAWVTGARNKDRPELAFVSIAFGTRIERTSTYVGGAPLTRDTGGRLSFQVVMALVSGNRQELKTRFEQPQAECSRMSQGALASETCTFTEAGLIQLPAALLDELARTHLADSAAMFRFRVETASGSITFAMPVAEIEAVRRSVFQTVPDQQQSAAS